MNALLKQYGLLGGTNITIGLILFSIFLSLLLGICICHVYRKTHSGFSYAGSFVFTLIVVTIIISLIMMVIQSNVALSLGLVGSLSVIRFRTVLKDTRDMAFLFWSICAGLAVGSGNYMLALISTVVLSGIIFCLEKIRFGKAGTNEFIMVLQVNASVKNGVPELLDEKRIKWGIRSSMIDTDSSVKEMRYSISSKLKAKDVENLLDSVNKIEGIVKVSLLSPETNLFV